MRDILNETLKCVRCGACKAYCPTYIEGLSEVFSARGRVVLVRNLLEERLKPSDKLIDDIYSCLLCDACKGQCPLNIDISLIIREARKILAGEDKRRRQLRWLIRILSKYPNFGFQISKLLGSTLYPYLYRKGLIPFRFTMPDAPLKGEYQVLRAEKKKGRVAIFVGCSTNYLFPHIGLSLINLLFRLGYEVVLPKGEVCCGAPFMGLGLQDDAVKMAKKNLSIFGKLNVEAVLTLCPTCLLSIRYHYGDLVGDLIDKAMDASVFIRARLQKIELRVSDIKSITYHDPCHHIHSLGISKEPREILRYAGMEIIENERGCCGFAGLFSISYRDISKALLQKRLEFFRDPAIEAIVTACPGCILQLSSGIRDKPVYHIVEMIESLMVEK